MKTWALKKIVFGLAVLALFGLSRTVLAQNPYNGFGWTQVGSTISITNYSGPPGTVVIPATIDSLPVTSIADSVFYNDYTLTNLTIPASVTNIGVGTFYFCVNLTNVTFGAGLTNISDDAFEYCVRLANATLDTNLATIGSYAFGYCYLLTNVTLSARLTTIGDFAFAACYDLTNVTIPASVTNLGNAVFIDSSGLTNITVASANLFYSSANGVLFDKSQSTLVEFPGGLGGNYTMPGTVTTISNNAFAGAPHVTGVTIPVGVTNIGQGAFNACTSLTNIVIPYGVTSIPYTAFLADTNLVSATLPESVTDIASDAFQDTALRGIIIPTNVVDIEAAAFAYCLNLTNIAIPAAVTNIGDYAFEYDASLLAINVDPQNPFYSSVAGVLFDKSQGTLLVYPNGLGGTYAIPDTVTDVGDRAFFANEGLTGVIFDPGVTNIGQLIFYEDYNLTRVCFEGNAVTNLGFEAFEAAPLTNILYVSGTTGWGPTFDGIPTTPCAECSPAAVGALQVNLGPSGAVTAGAQWQVDGGPLQNSGAVVTDLSVGSHTLAFSTVTGWVTPSSQSVTIAANTTNIASGTYVALGALQVNLNPPGAVSAGAKWQVDGGALQNSGAVVTGLAPGSHAISFNTVSGWVTPSSQNAMVTSGATNIASGTYVALGALQVNLNPPGAVSAGAKWQVDGGALQNSGAVVTGLAPGSHAISFNTVSGWVTPSSQNATVTSSATNVASATYQANIGSLQVTISPAGAVTAGAQWQVDGGPFQNSGMVVNNLAGGSHAVAFNTVTGWFTPASQNVTISAGVTNTTSGTYSLAPQFGALQVNLGPDDAVNAGARWQVDGGAFQSSGAVVTNLSAGSHTVSFGAAFGWNTPASEAVTIGGNLTNTITVNYTAAANLPGSVFVSETADTTNQFIEAFTQDGTASLFATGFTNVQGLAFDWQGNLYAADSSSIIEFPVGGSRFVFGYAEYAQFNGLAFDANGNLYAADAYYDQIDEFAPDGSWTVFASDPGDGSVLNNPQGLAFDSRQNLYAVNMYGGTNNWGSIEKFDTNGDASLFVSDPGDRSLFSLPAGIAINAADQIFVNNNGDIEEFSTNGSYSTFSTYDSNYPGLAFDSQGNLYSMTYYNIYETDTNGDTSGFYNDPTGTILNNPEFMAIAPTNSLVGWWKGDNNAQDSAGVNDGVVQGSVDYLPGVLNQAFNFDGSGGYVQIAPVTTGMSEGTVSLWTYLHSWNWQSPPAGLFMWAGTAQLPSSGSPFDGINLGNHEQYTTTGEFMFGIFDFSDGWNWAYSGVVPQTNKWYHLAGTWGPGGIQIYVNGQLVGTNAYTGGAPSYVNYNLIGRSSWPSSQIDGLVDDVRLYGTALSAPQIATLAGLRSTQPVLQITASGRNVVIRWPDPYVNYTVETDTNLTSTNWIPVAGTPADINGYFMLTNATPARALFFKLVSQ